MALASKTFRIFVSSTFSDLKEERNALQREVFPRLRELCRDHGCRFQAIDLRWGVREEAGLDQQTMKICLTRLNDARKSLHVPISSCYLGTDMAGGLCQQRYPAGRNRGDRAAHPIGF